MSLLANELVKALIKILKLHPPTYLRINLTTFVII